MNNTSPITLTAETFLHHFSIIEIIHEGNSSITKGENDCERQLSEKGIEQAKSIGRKQSGGRFDAVFASPLVRAHETARIATGREDIVTLTSLDVSNDPSDPINVMSAMLRYAPLGEYFKHELAEHLRERARNALSETVAASGSIQRQDGRPKVFIGTSGILQAAIAWAIGEVLAKDGIKSGEDLQMKVLGMKQCEAGVIVICFAESSRMVFVSSLEPSI